MSYRSSNRKNPVNNSKLACSGRKSLVRQPTTREMEDGIISSEEEEKNMTGPDMADEGLSEEGDDTDMKGPVNLQWKTVEFIGEFSATREELKNMKDTSGRPDTLTFNFANKNLFYGTRDMDAFDKDQARFSNDILQSVVLSDIYSVGFEHDSVAVSMNVDPLKNEGYFNPKQVSYVIMPGELKDHAIAPRNINLLDRQINIQQVDFQNAFIGISPSNLRECIQPISGRNVTLPINSPQIAIWNRDRPDKLITAPSEGFESQNRVKMSARVAEELSLEACKVMKENMPQANITGTDGPSFTFTSLIPKKAMSSHQKFLETKGKEGVPHLGFASPYYPSHINPPNDVRLHFRATCKFVPGHSKIKTI